MAYIGNIPADKYTSFAKQDFTVTATTSYTLDHSVSNENEIALFINFVRQEPTTAYTATGTSLTLSEATSVGDDMYCVFIGKAVQTVTPADNTISNSMIKDGTIAESKLASGVNTITVADQYRLTADFLGAGTLTAWEQIDGTGQGTLGSSMSVASGIFTFPSTGIYMINLHWSGRVSTSADTQAALFLQATTDNSTYSSIVKSIDGGLSGNEGIGNAGSTLLDVTDTSNVKVKVITDSFNTSGDDTRCFGASDANLTSIMFIRLGDT